MTTLHYLVTAKLNTKKAAVAAGEQLSQTGPFPGRSTVTKVGNKWELRVYSDLDQAKAVLGATPFGHETFVGAES